jgi:N-acetyl-gamma-glutamyl-phosphate reductase
MLKVAILGGSGYTGAELLRLLTEHPHVQVTAITSERSAGIPVSDLFLNFRNIDLNFEHLDLKKITEKADLFFLCLPHKASQETVAFLYEAGKKVVDLSADYRLKNAKVYEDWYKTPHNYKRFIKKAVYGLPELYRKQIEQASLVANPGCYPTSAILGLAPLMGADYIDHDSIIVDSKSGTSGAGRNPAQPFMFCETNESVRAYGISVHRHTPEIEQELSLVSQKKVKISFTPHLIPMNRGILSTMYVRLTKTISLQKIQKAYNEFYQNEPFVRVLRDGLYPSTWAVKGTNYCDISLFVNNRTAEKTVIIISAIDNLLKGASGAAVQNMNIMCGFEETAGLLASSPSP